MWHEIPGDRNVKQHLCEHLSFENFVSFDGQKESAVKVDIGMVVLQNCVDLLKADLGSYTGSGTVHSDGENQAIVIKVEEDIGAENGQDPVAISFPKIKV